MGIYGGQVLCLSLDPLNPSTLYAGTWCGGGLFRSTDAGHSWMPFPSSAHTRFRNCEVFDLALDPALPSTLWVANKQQIDLSTDAGRSWHSIIVAPDRFVYCLAIDPHDPSGKTVYAGTSGRYGIERYGSLYRTQDAGESWHLVLTAPYDILDVAVNPATEGHLAAVSAPWSETPGCVGHLFVSEDAGNSWSVYTQGVLPEERRLRCGYLDETLIATDQKQTIITGGAYGVLRFEVDAAGESTGMWSLFGFDTVTNALCAAPGSPPTLYAATTDGLRTSTDAGTTWSQPFSAPLFLCLQADPRDPARLYGGSVSNGVFTSSDYGATWSRSHQGISANAVYATAVSSQNPDRIACATLAGLLQKDHDAAWTLVNDRTSYAVLYHPCNDNLLYAGFDNTLGKSTDGGNTWQYLSVTTIREPHDILTITASPQAPHILFVGIGFDSGTHGSIIRVADNATSFSESTCTTVLTTPVPVNTIVTHPELPDTLFAGTGWFYAPGIPGALYISRDHGWHWSMSSLRRVVVNSIALSPNNPCIIYAACGESGNRWGGVFKSTDCGISWTSCATGLPAQFSATDLTVDTVNTDTVYVGLYDAVPQAGLSLSGVYASFSAGAYWTQIGLSDYALHSLGQIPPKRLPQTPSPTLQQLTPPGNAIIIAGTESGLFATSTASSGLVTGVITSAETDLPLDGVLIAADSGLHCTSSAGFYCLMLPAGKHALRATAPGYLPVEIPDLTVPAGGSVEQPLSMQPLEHDNQSLCLAERLLEDDHRRWVGDTLRRVRDQMGLLGEHGSRAVRLYYDLEKEVWDSINNDPGLLQRCQNLLLQAACLFSLSTAPSGKQIAAFQAAATCLLLDIERRSPQKLAPLIRDVRTNLFPKVLSDLTGARNLPVSVIR